MMQLLFSDYDKGFLELDDINHIAKVAGDIPIFLDTKKPIQLNLFNRNINYIKNQSRRMVVIT